VRACEDGLVPVLERARPRVCASACVNATARVSVRLRQHVSVRVCLCEWDSACHAFAPACVSACVFV
jgi:hypothetical protein